MTVLQSVVNGFVVAVADEDVLLLEPSSSVVQPVAAKARMVRQNVEKIALFMMSKTSSIK
jgi:hypothetical protein